VIRGVLSLVVNKKLIINSWVPSVGGKVLCVREGTLQMVGWDTVHK
jgi:membrane protein YqaA with SNARE-associated domain